MSLIRCTALGCRRKNGVNGDTPQGQLFVYGNQHKVYDMTTQHLYYQTSGSRTTPSGVISPMSPEWNLNTAAQRPVETAKGLNVQGPVPAVFVEVCCLVGSMEKNMMQKHTSF